MLWHGHEVVSAETGKDGIAMATAEQPELVLMDVVMPETNGFQGRVRSRAVRRPSTSP